MALTRTAKPITLKSPLGEDALLVQRMVGSEHLGRLFELELDLLSPDEQVDIDAVLGEPMTVALDLPEGGPRYFNGIVSRFSQVGRIGGYAAYRATLRPWLWLLTRSADCRIWQQKTVPDIITEVFRDHGFTQFDDKLSGSYRTREFCVQYRETAFNFVSRLMEQEGIYYYFQHSDGVHTLVLADSYGAHETVSGYETVPYYPPDPSAVRERDHVFDWLLSREVQSGAYAVNDFDFVKPTADLLASTSISRQHAHASLEIYDYPGEYVERGDGEGYAQVRLDELQAQFEQARGRGSVRGLASGQLFKLSGHPRDDQNKEFLVTSISHDLQNDAFESGSASGPTYSCSFLALDSATPYRSRRVTPKPLIRGPQTAIVVGKAGDEIHTDQYGRVRVHFHWDRHDKSDDKSSCWIRVGQAWAGMGWGGIHIPRVGHEVIVEFLEGDPDQPIITGRVYNGDNGVPYGLPDNATQSGIKSRSSKGGSAENFNEIRFEDKKGDEEVYIQAEKNKTVLVKNDRSENVGHDETISIGNDRTEDVGNNEKITIGNDRTESVGNNETITIGNDRTENVGNNETISVGSNRTETVGANETISVGGNRTVSVSKSETLTVTLARTRAVGVNESVNVGGAQEVAVGAAQTITVGATQATAVGGSQSVSVGAGRTTSVGADDTLTVKKNLVIDAGDSVVIKTGKASITMKKDGTITIKGKDIKIEASGEVGVKASKDITMKGKKILQN